jgi:ABC-2 type transport system ATP-binding protein
VCYAILTEEVPVAPVLEVTGLTKSYASGFEALKGIDLSIDKGEIFALLGPNGAGKTTLISIICGLVTLTKGQVRAGGFDIQQQPRAARRLIGLVPQELAANSFEKVITTVRFSRGLFGCPPNEAVIEQVLKDLSLWDKRNNRIMTLSGGMKRRLMIAKALAHEPQILFLDEPTAGVDVELRRDMWQLVRRLRDSGVTIILTTHYIEEAEEMADRIGVINHGRLIMVDDKQRMMEQLGQKELIFTLPQAITTIPESLRDLPLTLTADGFELRCHWTQSGDTPLDLAIVLQRLQDCGLNYRDVQTRESSLEDIFVDLIQAQEPA